ncbi:MAG: hypothetical protein WC089_00215 [Candidatus Paceibacterota bacterium]
MEIKQKILKEPVLISGKDYWGRSAWIKFSPSVRSGWWWKTKDGVIPINHKIAEKRRGQISLCSGSESIAVWEHIGVLRFLGFDCVEVESSPWAPYDGSALIYYEHLEGKFAVSGSNIPWVRITEDVKSAYDPNKRDGYVKISPVLSDGNEVADLCLSVEAGWSPLPSINRTVFASDQDYLLSILGVKAQGYPHYLYNVAKVASKLGYPHFKELTWLEDHGPEKTAELFFSHRVLDLLGCMSLCHHEYLPVGHVESRFAGHEVDLSAVKKCFVYL